MPHPFQSAARFLQRRWKGWDKIALSSGNPYYYLSDHLGLTAVIGSGDGKAIEWEADYFPFGNERQVFTNLVSNLYQFTGYEYDSSSGYNYALARFESGKWSRFLSPDPYLGSMDVTNPQSLNRYAYARNNPAKLVDPLGLVSQNGGCSDPLTVCTFSDDLSTMGGDIFDCGDFCFGEVASGSVDQGTETLPPVNNNPGFNDCDLFGLCGDGLAGDSGPGNNHGNGGNPSAPITAGVQPSSKADPKPGDITDQCRARASAAVKFGMSPEDIAIMVSASVLSYMLPGGGSVAKLARGAAISQDARLTFKSNEYNAILSDCLEGQGLPAPEPGAFF